MAYSAMIRLITSLDKDVKFINCQEKGTRDLLEHVKAVCDKGERSNSITW